MLFVSAQQECLRRPGAGRKIIFGEKTGGAKKNFGQACLLGWDPLNPPPNPTFRCPHPDKKGTNLLLFQMGIHLHIHHNLILTCC